MLVRIYTVSADKTIESESNRVRLHGGNTAWFDTTESRYAVTIRNLCAARNAAGKLSYVVFTSEFFGERTIEDVCRELAGASYPAGFYEF